MREIIDIGDVSTTKRNRDSEHEEIEQINTHTKHVILQRNRHKIIRIALYLSIYLDDEYWVSGNNKEKRIPSENWIILWHQGFWHKKLSWLARSLHSHYFSKPTPSDWGYAKSIFFCFFTTVFFRWFSGACLGIFGRTTKSNGLFQWTSNGLTANPHPNQWKSNGFLTDTANGSLTEVRWTASKQGLLLVLLMKKYINNK